MSEDPHATGQFDAEEPADVEWLLGRERFSQARFDVGYVRADVDALVDALRSAYAEHGRIDGVIESHLLHTAGFREGYEVTEFEDWIAALVRATGIELGDRPAAVAAASGSLSGRRSRRTQTEASPSSVITEKKGLLSRLRHH